MHAKLYGSDKYRYILTETLILSLYVKTRNEFLFNKKGTVDNRKQKQRNVSVFLFISFLSIFLMQKVRNFENAKGIGFFSRYIYFFFGLFS
jgi:hypothetical protein